MPVELPTLPVIAPAAAPSTDRAERERLIGRARTLSWVSLAWMTVEGAVGIVAALAAGSIALLGFGLDSVIEALASIIVIWRFTGRRRVSDHAERRAQQLVVVSFFLLAPYIAQDAVRSLIDGIHPSGSWVGIGLSIASLVVMPLLGRAKQQLGRDLGSAATAGEGSQNILCAYLAAGVLVGLALNTALGVWWTDPVIALTIAGVAVNEGRATWRGEGCCTSSLPAGEVCCDQEGCTPSAAT